MASATVHLVKVAAGMLPLAGGVTAQIKGLEAKLRNPMQEIQDSINILTGMSASQSRMESSIENRLEKRIRELALTDINAYCKYFKLHRRSELEALIPYFTIHFTSFFREPKHFDILMKSVFPQILTLHRSTKSRTFTIWSAAASTGEELYSIAICWLEFLRESGIKFENAPQIKFIGTDIDPLSIAKAQKGIYKREYLAKLSPSLLKAYFDFGAGDLAQLIKVKDAVHGLCNFHTLNLLQDKYPVKNADVIFLRNVLIYFNAEDIKSIAQRLHDCLRQEGWLFIGHSESLANLHLPYEFKGNAVYVPKPLDMPGLRQLANPQQKPLLADSSKDLTSDSSKELSKTAIKPANADNAGKRRSGGPIKVFIIDDSKTVRMTLRHILHQPGSIEIVGEAEDPIEAEEKMRSIKPDLITLDINMPRMTGVEYLQKIHGQLHPPVVVISALSYEEGNEVFKCLELGAVDFIEKPSAANLQAISEQVTRTIHAAFASSQSAVLSSTSGSRKAQPMLSYQASASKGDLILIGASTGGVEAIHAVLRNFPQNCPPTLITQHIPAMFSAMFAKRLQETTGLKVAEATDGTAIAPGHVYIAPGGYQLGLRKVESQIKLRITDDAPVNRFKPSVDYMFQSALPLAKDVNMTAIILTGMGGDGAKGLLSLKQSGAYTIGQDEATSVVYGMPKVAFDLGATQTVLPLHDIAAHIFSHLQKKRAA